MYNIIYEMNRQSRFDAGSRLVHWDDPEGWDGEGGRRGVRMRNMCIPVVDSC